MDRPGRNLIHLLGIDHIVLRTGKVAELIRFYSEVLGCELERQLKADIGLSQLRAGNALIDIVDVNSKLGRVGGEAPRAEGHNVDHFCLQIAAVNEQELLDWLSSQGLDAGPFETRYGATGFGPSIYIQDPDGNTVELKPIC